MKQATAEASFFPVESTQDVLTSILRRGARQLLASALEAEVEAFQAQYAELRDELGRRAVVRNGFLPEREVQTGIGPVPVSQPRVRTRRPAGGEEVPKFTSKITPSNLH